MRNRLIINLLALLILQGITAQELPVWAEGAIGSNLKEIVRKQYSYIIPVGKDTLVHTIAKIDSDEKGEVLNRFSNATINSDMSLANFRALGVMPSVWFNKASETEKDFIYYDLNNLFLAEKNIVDELEKGYGPDNPVKTIKTIGNTVFGELSNGVGVWVFPTGYEGELARAFLYMATIYPMTQWSTNGVNFLNDEIFPTIHTTTLNLLLDYHFNNSPTEREVIRNRKVREAQGLGNPFIDYPQLAYYIWVASADEIPSIPDDNNGDDDIEETPIPLKGRYNAEDKWIWLYSPYINEAATWKIDGIEIADKKIPIESLKKGNHILEYTLSNEKGKLTICVD